MSRGKLQLEQGGYLREVIGGKAAHFAILGEWGKVDDRIISFYSPFETSIAKCSPVMLVVADCGVEDIPHLTGLFVVAEGGEARGVMGWGNILPGWVQRDAQARQLSVDCQQIIINSHGSSIPIT